MIQSSLSRISSVWRGKPLTLGPSKKNPGARPVANLYQVVVDFQRKIRDPDVASGPWIEELTLNIEEEDILINKKRLLTGRSMEATIIPLETVPS